MPRGRSRDQYNPGSSRIVVQADPTSPEGNPWEVEMTPDQVRRWIINRTPGINTVIFRNELPNFDSPNLRTLYADPSVFFADPISSYEIAHDPQTRQQRHNWRRMARNRHYTRLQLIADGTMVRRIMCVAHPWIWRRHVEYLKDNNKQDTGRPSDQFRQKADQILESEFVEIAGDWADSRPRADALEVPPPQPSTLFYERTGHTREEVVDEAREIGVPEDLQRMKPTARDVPPTKRSASSSRPSTSGASTSRGFVIPSDQDRPARSDRNEQARRKRHASRSSEREAKVSREGSTSSGRSPSFDLRSTLSTRGRSTTPPRGSPSTPPRGRQLRLINVPSRNQPPHPDLAATPKVIYTRTISSQTDPYLMLDHDEDTRYRDQVTKLEDDLDKAKNACDRKSDDLFRAGARNDSLEKELKNMQRSRDDARKDVASYRSQKVKLLQRITELEKELAEREQPVEDMDQGFIEDKTEHSPEPVLPADAPYRPQPPPTPPRASEPTPSTSTEDLQRPALLRSILSTPKKEQEAQKARVQFGEKKVTKFTVDALSDDGSLNVVLGEEPVVTSLEESSRLDQQVEGTIPTEEQDVLLGAMEVDERISEADVVNCPDAIDGLVIKPHKGRRKKELSQCNYEACLMRQPGYYSYHYDDLTKGTFAPRLSHDAKTDTEWKEYSLYNLNRAGHLFVMGNDRSEWTYDALMPRLLERNFGLAIDEAGFFSLEILNYHPSYIAALDKKFEKEDQQSKKDAEKARKVKKSKPTPVAYPKVSDNAFAGVVIGNTKGDVLLVKLDFDGKETKMGIPRELVAWIQDKRIFKVGFNMSDRTIPKLDALGIKVTNPVSMENWTAMCYPQTESAEFKPVSRNATAKFMGMPADWRYRGDNDEAELGSLWSDEIEMSPLLADFRAPYKDWTLTMKKYTKYLVYVSMAILDKSASRLTELDGFSSGFDVRIIQHFVMAWLVGYKPRTVYKFEDDEELRKYVTPFPDWMANNCSTFKGAFAFKNAAWPLFFTEKLYSTWPSVFHRLSDMRRRHEIIFESASQEIQDLTKPYFRMTPRFASVSETLEKDCANVPNSTGGQNFPHACTRCGDFNHSSDSCAVNVTCEYKLCTGDKTSHDTRLCPTLNGICTKCLNPGHEEEHHKIASLLRLWYDHQIARRIGIRSAKLFNINMGYEFKRSEGPEQSRIVLRPLVDVEPQ